MSTVKITDLPPIITINSNTANTVIVGVDIPTNITGQISVKSLAAGLYSNNTLAVGNNYTILPNVVGQFSGNTSAYLQVNLQNQDGLGSGDYVITANDGNDLNHYIDLGLNGSNYSDGAYSATDAHDGYLYVQSSGTGKGNLIIGTTNSTGRVKFVVGGVQTQNIVGYIDNTGIWSGSINSLITANATSANAVIDSRISANVATLRGEITANADSANSVINTRISANIATANIFTQAAFDKANTALQNTTGIFAGSLTVTNNLTTNGIVKISNSAFSTTQAALTISSSNTGVVQTPGGDGYVLHLTGKHNIPTRIVADSFGANGQLVFPIFGGRAARGNVTNPSAVQTNDVITRIGASGFGATSYQTGGTARLDFVATENHTDAARGTAIKLYNVANGTNVVSEIATFNANDVVFTGVVNPEKGFIYTPRILTGAQTAITIDFANDSMIRATFAATLTMSFSNYTYGKVVEAWLTNTAGNGQTINLGVLANNSTTGSSTLSVAAGRSAKLQYFSIDGDLSNTFVAITYA